MNHVKRFAIKQHPDSLIRYTWQQSSKAASVNFNDFDQKFLFIDLKVGGTDAVNSFLFPFNRWMNEPVSPVRIYDFCWHFEIRVDVLPAVMQYKIRAFFLQADV